MIPEKAKAVLSDFRSGKASTAAELAKLHGVSRSAVYRLLKQETAAASSPHQEKPAASKSDNDRPQRPEKQTEEDGEADTGFLDNLYTKAEQFANSLGLPEQAGQVKNEEPKDAKAEQAKEEQLDALMEAMMGNSPQQMSLPAGLEAALSRPMPQLPTRVSVTAMEENDRVAEARPTEAKRSELTQKIIFNIQHFGSQLEVITGSNKEQFIQSLTALSAPQLKETLAILERTRSVGNIANGFKHLFYVTGQATETATQIIGMSTSGFTQQLRAQDEEVTMIMKELAIEQWERLKIMDSPQVRLGMLFCMTLVQVDTRNKLEAHFKQTQPVPEHIAKSSTDL